jgi:hypothetical protein
MPVSYIMLVGNVNAPSNQGRIASTNSCNPSVILSKCSDTFRPGEFEYFVICGAVKTDVCPETHFREREDLPLI